MLTGPYVDAIGKMERRFLTTSVVPTLIFLTAYTAVLIASVSSFTEAASWLSARSAAEQVLLGVVISSFVWFVAGLLSSNWRKIVRLYEGYPLKRWLAHGPRRSQWNRLRLPGFGYHRAQKDRLAARDTNAFYRRYPLRHDKDTLPTTIGNILLSSERYGLDRYGFEMNVLWTRFAWCLPENVQQSLDRFKEEHQLPLALSFISAAFAALSGVTVALVGGSPQMFVVSTAAGGTLSVLAYLLAIERTEEYAEQLRATIDLHHTKLRDAWTAQIPDVDLEHWFEDARVFVERGRESLNARRQKRQRQQTATDNATVPPVPSTGSLTRSSAPRPPQTIETTTSTSLRTRVASIPWLLWAAFCGRIRLLWIVTIVSAISIATCTTYLQRRTDTIFVAASGATPGNVIRSERRTVRAADTPRDAVHSDDDRRTATKPVAPGEVITASNSTRTSEISTLMMPTDSPLPGTPIVSDVLIAACGRLIENVVVTPVARMNRTDVALALTRDQTKSLAGCSPDKAILITPNGST